MRKRKDLVGLKFGRLTVLDDCVRDNKEVCRCDCGKLVLVKRNNLMSGATKSCGCYRREVGTEHIKEGRRLIAMGNVAFDTNVALISKIRKSSGSRVSNTGEYGVWHNTKTGKYVASIMLHKKRRNLGVYNTLEAAVSARKKAEEELFDPIIERWDAMRELDSSARH